MEVLKPYVSIKPDGIVPILLLEMYHCHMMEAGISIIEVLGIEVLHTPGGCTCLCQPIDAGINKSLKLEVQKLWDWMVDFGLSQTITITIPPTQFDIAKWVMQSYYLPE